MPAAHTPIQPRYLTLAEAAVYCSLSEKTLLRAISRGHVAHFRPCRSVLVSVADLEADVATTRVEAVDSAELAVHGNVYVAIAEAVGWLDATGQLLGSGEYLRVVVGVWIASDDLYARPSERPAAKEMLMAVVCDGNGEISIATNGGAFDDEPEATDGRKVIVMRAARAAISRE